MSDDRFPGWHGTTILAVRRGGKVVVAGDGQVSVGQGLAAERGGRGARVAVRWSRATLEAPNAWHRGETSQPSSA